MSANPSPTLETALPRNAQLETVLRDASRWITATLWLLETEMELRPERRTEHLSGKGKRIRARIDELVPKSAAANTEQESAVD